jgi:predicted DNA-binding transcriptional regulator YafY
MRASRLVSLLLLLQTRERMTAQELADELEVSIRTVYRDVESLSSAGVPVYGEAGHDGGYRLLAGYRTRLTGLTVAEAESLFLTGIPAAAADLGLGAAVTAAQLKLMASLPAELRDRAGQVAERFHLDAPSWYRDAEHIPHLTAVANAVWNQLTVRMRYLRWAQPQEITRVVEPHGLVLKAGHWYLVARGSGQFRTYRVSRILDVDVLTQPFDRAEDFTLATYWDTYLRQFDQRLYQGEATVRVSPDALSRVPDSWTQGATDERGWTEVTAPIESLDEAVRVMLKLGADAEVLAPADLRDRLVQTLDAMTRVYGCVTDLGRETAQSGVSAV